MQKPAGWSGLTLAVLLAVLGAMTIGMVGELNRRVRSVNSDLLWSQGCDHLFKGDIDQALSLFEESRRVYPLNGKATYMLGVVRFRRHEYAAAERQFREYVDLAPQNPSGLNGIGASLAAQEHPQEAIPFLRRATHIAPGTATYHHNLAQALTEAKRMDEARLEAAIAKRLRGMHPTPDDAYEVKTTVPTE